MCAKKPATKTIKPTQAGQSYTHRKRETQLLIEQAALYRLSVALNRETELQAMMDIAVRAAAELFKVKVAAISLVDEGGDTYSDKANIGWPPGMVSPEQRISLNVNNGLTYAIRNQKVVAIPDESKETRFDAPSWVLQLGIRSALIAPMIVGGKTVGGLVVNDRKVRKWNKGEERLIALIANDIAEAIERATLAQRLEKSERRFRALVEHSTDAIVLLSVDGTIKYHSSTARRILGDAVDELIGQNAFGRIHPDDLPHAIELFKKLLEVRQGSVTTEVRYRHSNGSWTWLEAIGTNLLDDPDVQAIVANYRDITERKKAQEQIRFQSSILDQIHSAAVVTSLEGKIIYWNRFAEKFYGWKSEEVLNQPAPQILVPAENMERVEEIREVMKQRDYWEGEFSFKKRDGTITPTYVSSSLVRDDSGEVFARVGVHVDITERKRTEQSRAELNRLLEESLNEIYIFEAETLHFSWVNYGARHNLGYSLDELRGLTPLDLKPEFNAQTFDGLIRPLRTGEKQKIVFETKHRRKDNSLYDVEVHLQLAYLEGQQVFVAIILDITERKQAERVLRESEERFSKTFRFSPIAIGISTLAEGRIIDVNDAYLRIFGYDSKEEVLGRTTLELNIYMGDLDERNHLVRQIQENGYVRNYEGRLRTRSGEERYALTSIEPLELRGEQCLLAFSLDITERKRAEESLRQSEERYEWAIRATHEGIWEWNIATNQIYSSPRWKGILGFEDHEIPNVIGELEKRLHPDDRERFSARVQAYLDGQAPGYELEFRAMHKDGSYRWIHSRAIIVRDAKGKPVRLVGSHSDITERKRAESVLRESEERFSKVFHSSPIAISIHTFPDGRIVDLNTSYLRMFGFDSKDEMIGRTTIDLGLWVDLAERNSLIEQIQLQGYVRNFEVRFRTRGGEICYALASIEQFELNGEQCVLAFTVDITQRKRLELQQNRLAAALDAAGEMIIITDADVKIQYVNPAFEYITGYMRDEALGRNPNMLQGEKQEDEFYRAMWGALRQGDVWHGVVTDKKKSGDLFQSENTIAPIRDALEDIVGYVSVQRDITERVQHERELEAIAQLSVALRTAPVLADMTPLLLDQLLDLLKADSAVLIMRDAVSGDSVVEAVRGVPILKMSDRLGAGKGVAGYVIESGQPYLSQDLENDPRFARRMMIQGRWAAAFTPLATREQIIGALCIARQSASIPIEDLRLLNTIGELAANAIHRTSLHEETRRRLGQLSTLHNIDRAISSSFDLRLTLNIALDELTQYAGVGAASVLFLNHNLMTLEYAAERGFPRHLPKATRLNINQSYAGRAVLENQAVVADLATSNGFPELDALAKEGFTRYDGLPLIAKGKIRGVLEVFSHPSLGAEPNWVEFLETVANGLALAIDNMELFNGLQRSNSELSLAYDATLEGWSRALDLRDKETEGHTQRVTEMTLRLANAMNLDVTDITHLRRGALLHDIGKLGVPDRILLKPGPLTDDEWDIMRQHPQYAYDMLSPIPFLAPALVIPYSHHEKWDGTGYPRGLKGDAIPLAARIFAVADVWDALRSDRPYRRGWEEEKVCNYIREQSSKHFDPKVVEAFLALKI